MSGEANKAVVQRAVQRLNEGSWDGYFEMYDASAVFHGYGPATLDLEGAKQFYAMVDEAFPYGHLAIEDSVAEGDRVAVRYAFSATSEGEFMGIPPTGKPVVLTGQTILRFENGKVVERWQQADMYGFMVQLGAIPAAVP
jgi:predicted ester cyclase